MQYEEMSMPRGVRRRGILVAAAAGSLVAAVIGAQPVQAQAEVTNGQQANAQPGDKAVVDRVYAALKADRYSYYQHVTVAADKGVVTLGGFVGSAESQSKAKQIAAHV